MTTLTTADVPAETSSVETPEFEIVLGRRQIASLGLVGAALLAVFCGLFYAAGKSSAPKSAPVVMQLPVDLPPPPPPPAPATAEAPAAAETAPAPAPEQGPLFAEPDKGSLYLQMGAVEKGVAQVWAEGLRTHGLNAFVASGPSEKIFRVLVGPLPRPEDYQQAKQTMETLGLATFAKRIQQ